MSGANEFGTEDACPESPDGKHHATEESVHTEWDGDGLYVDVTCEHCGRSGCAGKIDLEEIDW